MLPQINVYCTMTKLQKTDNPFEMASKIYKDFEVNQSCMITGMDNTDEVDYLSIGELVIKRLKQFDAEENCYIKNGTERRRYVKLKTNHIGGFKAGKIFRYEIDQDFNTTIWRVQ